MSAQPKRFTNDKLLEILLLAPQAIAIFTGEEVTIQIANKAMIAIWGKDNSVIGKPLAAVLPELVDQPFIGLIKQVWRTGIPYEAKNAEAKLMVAGELKSFYFDFSYQAIKNAAGEIECVLNTATDITELNDSRILIAHAKAQQDTLNREQALNEELSATNEELSSAMDELNVSNEALEQARDKLRGINEGLEIRIAERTKLVTHLYQEVEYINATLESANEELASANEELITSNVELIESRQKLERSIVELADSEIKTRSIIQSAPFPIGIYTGREMRIAFANKAIFDAWGKGDDLIGKLYSEILPELDNQAIFKQLDEVFTTGVLFQAKYQRIDLLVIGELKTFYFNYTFTPLVNELGEIYGVMSTAADVTDIVMAKQQLEKAAFELATANEQLALFNEEAVAANAEHLAVNKELKTLYEQLKISKDETELAINAAGLGTFDLDPRTGSLVVNDLLKSWFGLESSQHIKLHDATDVISEKDRERVLRAIQQTMDPASGGDYNIHYSINNPKLPEPKIVRAIGKTLFNDQHQPIRFSGVLQDITEQMTSQNKMQRLIDSLSASDKKFRNLLKNAPVAINIFRTRSLIIENINDKMLEMWGKTIEIEGMTFAEVLPEMAYQPYIDILQEVFTTGKPYYGLESKVVMLKDGMPEERYFNFIYQPVLEENGSIMRILQVVTEVTEQVNSRKEIDEVNTRLNIALDAGGLGSAEVNLSTGELVCNEQFKKCFGLTEEHDFTYSDLFAAMLPPYREELIKLAAGAIETERIYQSDYEVIWPDGSIHWISSHSKPRYDSDGKTIKMVGIIADITEAKADEQRKNDFIGMVSHELKTPLTSLTAYVQLLQVHAKKHADSFAASALERANKQVKKMTTMINGFLNISRLESGKIHIDLQRFDMAKLVKEVEEESNVTINSHKVIFAPVEETFVSGDRDKIGQVIDNFINNAVKYSLHGSTIHVACITVKGTAQVSVKDEGRGVVSEDQQRIFERFYRVKDQPKTISGFGIGLYVCAEVIHRHQGKIWLESEIGKGSTFYFNLPI
ncbi:MAG: PAS domain-containing protein [Sphingobacteriaceae bacterium]